MNVVPHASLSSPMSFIFILVSQCITHSFLCFNACKIPDFAKKQLVVGISGTCTEGCSARTLNLYSMWRLVTTCNLGEQTLCHRHLLWVSQDLTLHVCRPLIYSSRRDCILAALLLQLLNYKGLQRYTDISSVCPVQWRFHRGQPKKAPSIP